MRDRLSFWADYLQQAQDVTNVTLVTEDGQQKATLALLLASVSHFLGSLLLELKDIKECSGSMLPEDRVARTMDLQEDIAAKTEIIKKNAEVEAALFPQGEIESCLFRGSH